ncbi:MAG: hypothetical protein ACP5RH_01055 [Leptodesmis sp.]|uniref:hypothetical protein n=1 Tax=Leptodesmis sp. TaxID=3100501 RepID=UPI003D115F02
MDNQDQIDQILAALNRQTGLLQEILAHLQQSRLGFRDVAGRTRIYCNRQHGSCWYRLDADNNPVPIPHAGLTGYVTKLEFSKVQRRGKETIKLQVSVRADCLYVLEAGYDSYFSKGLLSAIASLTPEQIRKPITIRPQPGEDEAVLFCRVEQDSTLIRAPYDDLTDWRGVAAKAIALVNRAWASQ